MEKKVLMIFVLAMVGSVCIAKGVIEGPLDITGSVATNRYTGQKYSLSDAQRHVLTSGDADDQHEVAYNLIADHALGKSDDGLLFHEDAKDNNLLINPFNGEKVSKTSLSTGFDKDPSSQLTYMIEHSDGAISHAVAQVTNLDAYRQALYVTLGQKHIDQASVNEIKQLLKTGQAAETVADAASALANIREIVATDSDMKDVGHEAEMQLLERQMELHKKGARDNEEMSKRIIKETQELEKEANESGNKDEENAAVVLKADETNYVKPLDPSVIPHESNIARWTRKVKEFFGNLFRTRQGKGVGAQDERSIHVTPKQITEEKQVIRELQYDHGSTVNKEDEQVASQMEAVVELQTVALDAQTAQRAQDSIDATNNWITSLKKDINSSQNSGQDKEGPQSLSALLRAEEKFKKSQEDFEKNKTKKGFRKLMQDLGDVLSLLRFSNEVVGNQQSGDGDLKGLTTEFVDILGL